MAVNVNPGYYNRSTHYGVIRTRQVTVLTTATRILEQVDERLGVVVTNAGAATVYVGSAYDVVNGNGHALLIGDSLSLVSSSELFGAVAADTVLVTVLEETVR
jgi:hypothetical protein